MNPTDDAVATALREIACHLRDNPLASDSVDGIWRWWLSSTDIGHSAVQAALDALADRHFVEAHTAADGLRRYRLAVSAEALAALCAPAARSGSNPASRL